MVNWYLSVSERMIYDFSLYQFVCLQQCNGIKKRQVRDVYLRPVFVLSTHGLRLEESQSVL